MRTFNQQGIVIGKYFWETLFIKLIFLMILTFTISACISLGKDFPEPNVKAIQIGQTTKDEIRELFGSPWLSGINDGELAWTYGNYDYSLFGKRGAKDLVIQFDKKGVVTTFTYSTTEHNE